MHPFVFCSFFFMLSTPSPMISSFVFLCCFLKRLYALSSVIRSFSFAILPWFPTTYFFLSSSSSLIFSVVCFSFSVLSRSGLKVSQSTPSVATAFLVVIPRHVSSSARYVDGTISRSGFV